MAKFVISIEQKGTGKDTLIEKQTLIIYNIDLHIPFPPSIVQNISKFRVPTFQRRFMEKCR